MSPFHPDPDKDLEEVPPRTMIVPGRRVESDAIEPDAVLNDDEFEGLISTQEISSASRSCFAIIVLLLIVGLLLCVFLIGAIVT